MSIPVQLQSRYGHYPITPETFTIVFGDPDICFGIIRIPHLIEPDSRKSFYIGVYF